MDSAPIPAFTDQPDAAPITGHVSNWYFRRRMIPLAAVLMFFGLYFLYDGFVGYPKANLLADKKDWFETELIPSYARAKSRDELQAWSAEARAKNWPLKANGEPLQWVTWAAQRNLSEATHRYTAAEIRQQYQLGCVLILASVIVIVVMLSNRGRTIHAEADHWITPAGRKILFSQVFKLDLRKWDQKGLAYAWYRENETGPVRKAVLDDFKFTQMQSILDRLLSQFKGELIQKQAKKTPSGINDNESTG